MENRSQVVTVFVTCLFIYPTMVLGCLSSGEETAATLHALKASLLRSHIQPPPSWIEANDCCSWEGVGCSNATLSSSSNTSGRVVDSLNLSGFEGRNPNKEWHLNMSVFMGFRELRHLDVSQSGISGPLESLGITGLRKLEHLDLSGNKIIGGIPASWTSLSSLRFLNMSHNSLSGPFPAVLTHLRKLQHLTLCWNNLNGSLPTEDMTGLSKLEHLDLSHNKFEGGIPASWKSLSSLRYLDMSGNQLSGPLPGKGHQGFSNEEKVGKDDNMDVIILYGTATIIPFMVSFLVGVAVMKFSHRGQMLCRKLRGRIMDNIDFT